MTKSAMVTQDAGGDGIETQGVPVDSTGEPLIKRQETADILGVTVSEVRRLERTGALRPKQRNAQGVWLFDAEEVHAMAKSRRPARLTRKSGDAYTPQEAARVFKALSSGMTPIQCVVECMVMPTVVEELVVAHTRMTGCMYLSKDTVDIINTLPLEGTFPLRGEAELLAVLQTAATDTCKECRTRSKTYCKACAIKVGSRVAKADL